MAGVPKVAGRVACAAPVIGTPSGIRARSDVMAVGHRLGSLGNEGGDLSYREPHCANSVVVGEPHRPTLLFRSSFGPLAG